ncbi:MAG: VWA domain-containing protein [Candidatus Peribacteria bacterium]|nr:VWA domain-containing protein [Candidatus Peribacteria bacterium]
MYFLYRKQKKSISFLFFEDLKKIYKKNNFLFYFKIFLLILIFFFYILLFANPNISNKTETISKNGIDIVLALDISTSMEATDLEPNRIESAKKIISEFIEKQETNRVGLVVFAGKPFLSIPLTFDYDILTETIENISTNNINQNYNALA